MSVQRRLLYLSILVIAAAVLVASSVSTVRDVSEGNWLALLGLAIWVSAALAFAIPAVRRLRAANLNRRPT
jgi:hypothetical protein